MSSNPILVVDDEEAILELVQMTLEEEGYEVALARGGAEALEMLARLKPCLILLDVRMPSMNGPEFARAYRASFSERAPIVVMTAGRDTEEMLEGMGATGRLSKPFALDELVVTVRHHGCQGAI